MESLRTYALGRGLEYDGMPVARKIVQDAALDDYAQFRYAWSYEHRSVPEAEGANGIAFRGFSVAPTRVDTAGRQPD